MSELRVDMGFHKGKTVLTDLSFTAPLKIAKPFYQDGYTKLMIMCASPGMLKDDAYDMRFSLAAHTKTVVTDQSYLKLFNTQTGEARQQVGICLGEEAELCYLPSPVIPFGGSKFYSRTDIELAETSRLFFSEIVTCGRRGMGEAFAFSAFFPA